MSTVSLQVLLYLPQVLGVAAVFLSARAAEPPPPLFSRATPFPPRSLEPRPFTLRQ